jgi:uncharacterized protein (UPF0548 family)
MTAQPLAPRLAVGATHHAVRAELARAAALSFNYPDAGATLSRRTPKGYDPVSESAVVGAGKSDFALLADGIRQWRIQTGSGLQVEAAGPAAEGVDVALAKTLGILGPVAIVLSCRVVWAVDEPRRSGFAYGSLRGHPEAGEEAFVAELDDDDAVTFSVFGFSRRGTVLTSLASPISKAMQQRTLTDYLRAAHRIVAGA